MNKFMNLKNQMVITIEQDGSATSPRDWDNLGTFYTWDSGYYSPDNQGYSSGLEFLESILGEIVYKVHEKYNNTTDFMNEIIIRMDKKGYVLYPVSKYEHSNVSYSLGCSSGWDTGTVGVIFADKKEICREFNTKRITSKIREKVIGIFEGELEIYTQYVNGDVNGYIIESFEGEYIDSCWGFYDDCHDVKSMYEMVSDYWEIGELDDWQEYDESIINENFEIKTIVIPK